MLHSKWPIYALQISANFAVYLFFVWKIFSGKMRFRRSLNFACVLGYAAFCNVLVCLFFREESPFPQYKYWAILACLAASVLMSLLLLRDYQMQLLFYIFMAFNIQYNIVFIARAMHSIDLFPNIPMHDETQYLLVSVLVLAMMVPVMWFLFLGLFQKVVDIGIDDNYWKYLFIIPLSAFCCCFFSSLNGSLYARKSITLTLATTLVFLAFNLLAYAVVLVMLLKTHDSIAANEETANMHQQLLIQSEQYKRLADNISQTERVRHDMRHHFAALGGYINEGDLESAAAYLQECSGRSLVPDEAPVCEKHAVDMLLRHYFALARQDEIEVQAAVQLPEDFPMPDTDLCVVFGNLVENALEACRKQQGGRRFISVKARMVSKVMLALRIANSFDGEVQHKQERLVSSKHDGLGIGTHSVQSIALRNGGTCQFSCENQVFEVSVLLIP